MADTLRTCARARARARDSIIVKICDPPSHHHKSLLRLGCVGIGNALSFVNLRVPSPSANVCLSIPVCTGFAHGQSFVKLAKLARITRVRNLTFRWAQETCPGSIRLKETHYNLPRERETGKKGREGGRYPDGYRRIADWIGCSPRKL
jgi:hypothetical protein